MKRREVLQWLGLATGGLVTNRFLPAKKSLQTEIASQGGQKEAEVKYSTLTAGPARTAAVKMHHGRPTIFINEEPRAPIIYALTDVPGGRWSWAEMPRQNIESFHNHGIHLFQLDIFLEHLWTSEDQFSLDTVRKQVAGVLEVCPEASIFLRFHLRAPRWWLHKHPEEWVVYADTGYVPEQNYGLPQIIKDDNNPVRRVSMASKKWRTAVTKKFKKFLHTFSQTPEGNALAGIQVANGIYGEWHNWGFYNNEPDVSPPMRRAFQAWLKAKYGTDKNLQKAWHKPGITFEQVQLPGMKARATNGIFRNPPTERNVIDYYECMHQTVADDIIHFAKVVKEEWPRPIITGTFYGYYFSVFGRQAAGGHLQLQRILKSDYIDYLSGPQAYEPESIKLGDPYRSRSLITSVRLHGKLWLDEMDIQPTIPLLRANNYDRLLQDSIANVRRDVMFSITKGMGLWFYDFGVAGYDMDHSPHQHKGTQGNWDHPAIMHDIERMKSVIDKHALKSYQSAADVLFVYDTKSFYYTASLRGTDPVSSTLIDYNTLNAFKSGVIFDPIHIDDLERIDLSQYKVVVFGNTYVLSEEQRRFIRERVAQKGRHLVWFYAPGYIKGDSLNTENISALIQMTVSPISITEAPKIKLSLGEDPADSYTVGDQPFGPLFAVSDTRAQALGRYSANGKVAVACKKHPNHTAWYVGLPNKKLQPMQYILQESGAHIYSNSGDIFYGGSGFLVIHTLKGGIRNLILKNGKQISVKLPKGPATVLLDSKTGDVLLKDYSNEWKEAAVQYNE